MASRLALFRHICVAVSPAWLPPGRGAPGHVSRGRAARGSVRDEALEVLRRLLPRGLRILIAAERARVVLGSAELDLRAEERPVRTRLVLVGHPDAAGVHPADAADTPVHLDVRVAGDDDVGAHAVEDPPQPPLRRQRRDDVEVVLRRGMAEENPSHTGELELDPFRETVEELDLLVAQRSAKPLELAGRRSALAWRRLLHELSLRVASEPADAVAEGAEPLDGLGREGSADDVTADDDEIRGRRLRKHGLERGQVSVDVVERGDPQLVHDFEHDAAPLVGAAGADERSERSRDPALAADHLA